ncbi:hypothetical protein E4T50_14487 [Aureobasidium sp. EXF-12298]|nr:hypothetical protein E4T50_14487 [Aureobasidium sp. EXF-12298]
MRVTLVREVVTGLESAVRSSQRNIIRTRSSHLAPSTYRSFNSQTRRYDGNTPAAANTAAPRAPVPQSSYTPKAAAAAPAPAAPSEPMRSLTDGLSDPPPTLDEGEKQVDWSRSFHGISSTPFSSEAAAILTQDIDFDDIEIKPDGIIYLPEIKYRRILNKAFGPGGWGLVPRGETIVTGKLYFDPDGIPTATEGCKSNALMRCCKDLGIASELWDPRFIRKYMKEMAKEMIVEHVMTKKRRKHFMRKDDELKYPFKEVIIPGQTPARK